MTQEQPVEQPAAERFVEGDDSTVIDTRRRLVWMKFDSWQIKQKWINWNEAREFSDEMNNIQFAGYNNWRLPTADEVKSLFDKKLVNEDHMGQKAFCSPLFPKGFGFLCWTGDVRSKVQAVRVGLRKGGAMYDNIFRVSRGAVRLVRTIQKGR
ncbi:MAG: DUF1566 domain-containing protein [Candidatus Nitronauta litoralis]|uniref:DUF1566 domain-containing protein n=1 Tax=Candidatus Nitronauta litoralis TaxID=2705533 RepID=A0A7T0BU71_9BACT|nr:MAG: DUF1566 domain-containing protein [Candidatus Nitronauta litoralis]